MNNDQNYPHPLFKFIDSQILRAKNGELDNDELTDALSKIDAEITHTQGILELNSPLVRVFKRERKRLVEAARKE